MQRGSPMLPAAAFILVWSSGYIAGPYGVAQMAPFSVVAWRFILAALLTVVLARVIRGRLRATRSDIGRLAVTGLLLNGVQFAAMYLAFSVGLGATLGALLHSLSPLLTALLAGIFFRERLAPIQLIGFVIGVAGVVVVLGPRVDAAGGMVGLIAALISTIALSLGTLGQRWAGSRVDPMWSAAIQFSAAAGPLLILALSVEGTDVVRHPVPAALTLAYLVVINSIVGMLLLGVLVRRGGAGVAASTFFLMPAVTAVLAWLILGEQLGVREIVGLVIALTGVAAATVVRRPRRNEQR